MEKKGTRSLQATSKGLTTDSKKNQDVSGKAFPRGGRRREPQGGSLSAKCDPTRKPTPQRNKTTVDKRPRPRGAYQPTNVTRSTSTWLVDYQEAELDSVFLPGSKKQSLNHLLNFHYAPREGLLYNNSRSTTSQHDKSHRAIATHKHKYNKEHFLQANCQFIVNEHGDYKQYINNSDALVDWNLIEQVNVQVSEYPSCPICLYLPVAAKMTRCGHIYCWSCVLHYLALSEKTWSKCPICYEAVHIKDLKSVVAIPHPTLNVHETITFKLMKRAKGCLTAYPIDTKTKEDDVIFKMSDKDCSEIYSKLLLANNNDILSIIEREQNELAIQLLDDDGGSEKCFIEQAVTLLKERQTTVLNCLLLSVEKTPFNCDADEFVPKLIDELNISGKLVASNSTRDRYESLSESVVSNVSEELDISSISSSSSKINNQASKFYYFYQASDGQHIYLHAINAKMLEYTYGSLEFAPKTLCGKILEKEGGSMTEDLRKRLRYLQHLPVTCQFEVAEIQLRQPYVTKDTISQFQDQLEIRRKRRQKRAKEEKQREKRITDEENRKMGKFPVPNLSLESHTQFPEFNTTTLNGDSPDNPPLISDETNIIPPPIDYCTAPNSGQAGPSFAKMLAATKVIQPPSWPGLNSSFSSQVSDGKFINVTGPNMKPGPIKVRTKSDSEPDNNEDYEPVPVLNRSFGDVIAQALQRAAAADVATENEVPPSMGKKKKKKNKAKVLFATNMAYSGN